jgi:hypothetical protein
VIRKDNAAIIYITVQHESSIPVNFDGSYYASNGMICEREALRVSRHSESIATVVDSLKMTFLNISTIIYSFCLTTLSKLHASHSVKL